MYLFSLPPGTFEAMTPTCRAPDVHNLAQEPSGDAISPAVDKSGDRIRPMFASIASNYDRMNHLLSCHVDRYWRWWTVRKVAPQGDGPILDVCTGTGDLALAYWHKSKGTVPILATDFCPEMLEIGRQKQQFAGISKNLEFREADTTNLPFPNDQFQLVTVAFGLRNVSDTDKGLQEMTRVCRAGGRVAVLEFSMPTIQPFRSIYRWYFRNVLPKLGQMLARNQHAAYMYLPESVQQFPQGDAMLERMRQSGLEHLKYHPLTMGIATLYVGSKPAAASRNDGVGIRGGSSVQ